MKPSSRIINKEQIIENRKSQEKILDWLYPDRISAEEREQLHQEYVERRKHENNQNHS